MLQSRDKNIVAARAAVGAALHEHGIAQPGPVHNGIGHGAEQGYGQVVHVAHRVLVHRAGLAARGTCIGYGPSL